LIDDDPPKVDPSAPEPKVAVALSGGGHRACLFALGALLYLIDAGKGPAIASVSSVSGGSIANGVVAQGLDLGSAGPGDLGAIASRAAGQITSRGTLFGSAWTFIYLLLVGLVALASVALPWFLPIADAPKVALLLAGLVLTSGLLSARGSVCALAFDRTLFHLDRGSTRLADIHKGVDHVFCATDLHAGEHVYFSGGFVYSYRFGAGQPADLKLSTVVQASAAFPGAFPASWLSTKRHRFSGGAQTEASHTRRMALVDGGVYDNMADQWARGMGSRLRRHSGITPQPRAADELVVVNSSAGLGWGRLPGLRLPAVGELLTLLRDKSVLYDNGNSLRREALVTAFKAAEAGAGGMNGALVHIPQSPFLVPRAFAKGSGAAKERANAALAALTESGGEEAERYWADIARDNAKVATTLVSFDVATAARLLYHAYVLAMINLHVILGYPLLAMPDPGRFDAIAAGDDDPGPA
jgi:predicted acylesterase/phospholipase RssA